MCPVPSSLVLEYTKQMKELYLGLNDGGVKQISQEPGETSDLLDQLSDISEEAQEHMLLAVGEISDSLQECVTQQ